MRVYFLCLLYLLASSAHAQIAQVEAGALTHFDADTGEVPNVSTPTSGNLIMVVSNADDDDATFTVAETGFNDDIVSVGTLATASSGLIATKISDETEAANLTVNATGNAVADMNGQTFELSGINTTTPIGDTQDCGNVQNVAPYPAMDCSVTVAEGDWCYNFFHKEGGGTTFTGPPAGWTLVIDPEDVIMSTNEKMGLARRDSTSAGTCTFPAGGWESNFTGTDWRGATFVVQIASAAGEFDVTPAVASQTATAYTIDGSLDAAGTVDMVACPKDQTAPTIAQVQAGDCTGDVAAMATATASPAMTPFDFSEVLTLANGFRIADLYITDGTNLTTLADEELDCPASSNCVTLSGAPMTDPLQLTDCTTGDLVRIDSLTTPDGFATNIETDGSIQYFAGGDESRQFMDGDCYDVSAEALDLYD